MYLLGARFSTVGGAGGAGKGGGGFLPAPDPAEERGKGAAEQKAGARHKVVFRKKFTLPAAPAEAYATLLASQRFDVQVNGHEAKSVERDGFRNGRIALFNLKALLVAGENVITI